jgi:hypothetical protein
MVLRPDNNYLKWISWEESSWGPVPNGVAGMELDETRRRPTRIDVLIVVTIVAANHLRLVIFAHPLRRVGFPNFPVTCRIRTALPEGILAYTLSYGHRPRPHS